MTEQRKILEIPKQEFIDFLIRAKKAGYASGKEPKIDEEGMKNFFHQETIGNNLYCYHDRYSGYFRAPGTELFSIRRLNYKDEPNKLEKGIPIWTMSYGFEQNDGMQPPYEKDEKASRRAFRCLKSALMNPNEDLPVRGPVFTTGVFGMYEFSYRGDITDFSGLEKINLYAKWIFQQHISGRLIQHKDLEVKLV